MRSALFRARASVPVQKQLTRVRKVRDRLVDHPLHQVERARQRLLEGEVDVMVLGDSSTLSWSPRDQDRTLLPELIGRRLGSNVLSVNGPGYSAAIYGEFLRILGSLDRRPKAVVFAMAIRPSTFTHVMRHPVVGYPRSIDALAKVKDADHRIRYVGRGGSQHTDRQRAAYMALPVSTRWSGDQTIGYFRSRLEGHGPTPWPADVEALLFDYFHGETVHDDNPGLPALTLLGRRIEEYGVPTVGYWTKPPIERGEMHYPGEFDAHVRGNLRVLQGALSAQTTTLPPLLDVPLEDDDFENSPNANEHYSFPGRNKIADALAEALTRSV